MTTEYSIQVVHLTLQKAYLLCSQYRIYMPLLYYLLILLYQLVHSLKLLIAYSLKLNHRFRRANLLHFLRLLWRL